MIELIIEHARIDIIKRNYIPKKSDECDIL
jgi:hypothetical protein